MQQPNVSASEWRDISEALELVFDRVEQSFGTADWWKQLPTGPVELWPAKTAAPLAVWTALGLACTHAQRLAKDPDAAVGRELLDEALHAWFSLA